MIEIQVGHVQGPFLVDNDGAELTVGLKPLETIVNEQANDSDIELLITDGDEQKDSTLVWWASLMGPVLATALVLGVVYTIWGGAFVSCIFTAAATAFFITGRFIILLGSSEATSEGYNFLKQLTPTHLFAMLTWLDMMVAIFVAFHMTALFRIPLAGEKLKDLVSDGRFVLAKQPWIRRSAFLGLVLFVIFPTSTTGSIGGTIFGRLLGMTRFRVLTAIFLGSILGNGLMLVGANFFNEYFPADSLWLKLGGVAAICVALFLFERKIKSLKQRYLEEEQLLQQDEDPPRESLTAPKQAVDEGERVG